MESLYPPLRELSAQTPRELPPFLRRFSIPPMAWITVLFFTVFPLVFVPIIVAVSSQKSPLTGRAKGKIVQVERFRQNFGGANANSQLVDSQFVKYRFAVQNREFVGALSQNAPFPLGSENLRAGQTVSIAYDPKNPALNQPASQLPPEKSDSIQEIWPLFLFAPLMGLFFAGPMIFPLLRDWWRVRKLARNGALAQGHMVWARSSAFARLNYSSGAQQIEVEFEDAQGQKQSARATCQNDWLLSHLPPGAPVIVAYDPKKPGKRSVILEVFAG